MYGSGSLKTSVKNAIKLLGRVTRVFNMLFLVLSYRHNRSVVEKNICSHEHWVVKRADANLPTLRLRVLKGVCAHEVWHCGDSVKNPCEFGVCRHVRLFEKYHFLRVKADGEICHHQLAGASFHLFGLLHRVQRVVVGNEDKAFVFVGCREFG